MAETDDDDLRLMLDETVAVLRPTTVATILADLDARLEALDRRVADLERIFREVLP